MINEAVKYTVKVEIEGQSNSNDTGQTESIAKEITVNVMGVLSQPMLGEASNAGAQMPHSVTVTTSSSSSETASGSTCVAGGYGVRTNASSSTAMEVVSDGGSGSSEVIVVRLGGGKCFHRLTCGMAVKFQRDNPKRVLRMKLSDALKTSLKPCSQCGPEK